jgi:uncharacterized protein YutD
MNVAVKKTKRVQMELSNNSFERLNRLKEATEAPSYTEVMNDALRLFEYVIGEEEKGSKFLIESQDGKSTQIKIF